MNSRIKLNNRKNTFTKEIEVLKENQILELKTSINEMENSLESFGNKADQMEDRISDLEARNLEMIQVEEGRELRFLNSEKTFQELLDSIRRVSMKIMGLSEEKRRGQRVHLKK